MPRADWTELASKMKGRRIYLFSGLAYLFSLVDDSPVNADQLLGALYQVETEAILHILTILFLYLALREAATKKITWTEGALAAVAFVVSSLDDFPQLKTIAYLRSHHWYLLDITIHVASILIFYVAIREALREPGAPKDASLSAASA